MIIFILAILIVASGLVFILKKDEWFFRNNKEPEINPSEKFSYTPVMYKICDDDNCNYLVGAMHLGDAHIKNLSDEVIIAYKEMDALAVEVDTIGYTLDISNYILPEGTTIDKLISEELNKKLEEFSLNHVSFPYGQYKSFKLGLITDLLASSLYIELGYMTEGVDSYLLKLAHTENKEIIEIETIESQETFLNAYSDELYKYLIEDTIDTYDSQKELVKKLYDAYLAGDAQRIKDVLNLENEDDENISEKLKEELESYQKAMYDDRNIVMANAIEEYLANNKNVFVTVGAAHVVADNGIVEILKGKGYKITQMN